MTGMEESLAHRMMLYARQACERAAHFLPQHGFGSGHSAGPLLAVEMIGGGLRTAMLGLLLTTGDGLGDPEKIPTSLFILAQALDKTGTRPFSEREVEVVLMVDRILMAGIERHLLPDELCKMTFNHANMLAWQLAEDLQNRLVAARAAAREAG